MAALRGLKRRVDAERNSAVIGGWIAANLSRAGPRDFPDLAEVLRWFEPQQARPQTREEMVAAMRAWVLCTGGALAADNDSPDAPEAVK